MKKVKSNVSIILILCIMISLISGIIIKVNATEDENIPDLNIALDQLVVNGQVTTNRNVKINDEIEFKYKVTPSDIPANAINVPTKKEIVLVLDTSGSMNYDFNGNATTNEKNKRIYALKNAAKSFVDKFNGKRNVKIGIVPYSYYSGYKNEIQPLESVTSTTEATNLKSYIDNITVEGATNQGDGLRVAGNMLTDSDSDETAQKYLVFLTDGEPTGITFTNSNLEAVNALNLWATDQYGDKDPSVYTFMNGNSYTTDGYNKSSNGYLYDYSTTPNRIVHKSNNNYTYYDINLKQDLNEDDNLKYIDFNSNVLDNIPTKYAEIIGQKLKNDVPNFHESTIAYGTVKSNGTSSISRVNDSLGGKLYSTKDSTAITSIFNGLADEILQEYNVSNVSLNLNLPQILEFADDETKFRLGENCEVAHLDNIRYSLSADKTKYVTDPFYVSIKVKAKANGSVEFGASSNISYNNIHDNLVNKSIPITNIVISDNQLPNINAYLDSPIPNTLADPSQDIEVKYTVDTEPFEYNVDTSGPIDEAVFVVDETNNMSDAQRYTNFRNGFNSSILDGSILGERDIKFNAVGYNDNVNFPDSDYYNSLIGRKSEREKLRLVFQNQISMSTSSNNRNIESALDRANRLLQEKGEQGKNKAIILVTSGYANYNSDSDIIKTISKSGYKIISLDLSNCDGTENNNLKTLHHLLSGKDEDYILAKADGGNYNTPEANYTDSIAKKLAGGSSATTNSILISGAKLNFDLGDNFDAVENTGLAGTGKIRTVTLPNIEYTLVKDETTGKYLWTQTKPQSLEITFKVRPVQGKIGQLGFADDSGEVSVDNLKNYISYNGLDNTLIKKHIETPIINVVNQTVPKIDAEVINPPSEADLFKEIPLQYRIIPQKFNQNNLAKNIVFALDISKTTGNGNPKDEPQKIAEVKKALDVNLKSSQIKNASYGIVTYSRNAVFENYNLTNNLYPISNKLTTTTNDSAGHISIGEDAAVGQFKNDFSEKCVVIISSGLSNSWKETTGLYTYSTVDDPSIGTYKRIILDLSYVQNINEIGADIQSIFNQIENTRISSVYTFKTKLKFHSNDKFVPVSGVSKTSDSWYDMETPEFDVEYDLQDNGDYVPKPVSNVKCSIEAKGTGSLNFGDTNSENSLQNKFPGAVSYVNLANTQVFNHIEPFNIGIDRIVTHGLYKNVDSGGLAVIGGNVDLARGAIANLAVGFDVASSDVPIGLQVNEKIDLISDSNPIKIYQIINGRLVEISGASYTPQGNSGGFNNYSITLPSGINTETKLVIRYQCEIPTQDSILGPFTNKAFVDGTESDFTLSISSNLKPDLF